jgi:hypothetical protein
MNNIKQKEKSGLALLINPFECIAGWQALLIGLVVIALTAVFGHINHITFYGSLQADPISTLSLSTSFVVQAVSYVLLFLMMWIAGVCLSKSKIRAVDVAGTMALTRVPILLLTLICFLPITPDNQTDIQLMIVFGIICVPLMVWIVALMYNAYSVSCNLKGGRAILSFIGALLAAEIVSRIIIVILLGSLVANLPIQSTFAANTQEAVENLESLTIRQKAENVAKAFEQGNLDAIPAYFDDNMKKNLSASVLKLTWTQLNLVFGKFEKADIDGLEETAVDNNHIVRIPFIFQKEKRFLQLAFNAEGKISGLYIR